MKQFVQRFTKQISTGLATYTFLVTTLFAQIGGGLQFPGPGLTSVPPTPPVSGMTLWMDAACVTFVSSVCGTPSNGATLTAWADKSGNANSAVNGSAWPITYQTSQINSLPAILFSNGFLQLTAIAASTSTSGFFVFRPTGSGKGYIVGADLQGFAYWTGSPRKQGLEGQDVVALGNGTAANDTSWHQTNVVETNNSAGFAIAFRLDRASDATLSQSANNLTGTIHSIGDNFRSVSGVYIGYIAEIILYNRALSGSEVTTVETYLHNKYNL